MTKKLLALLFALTLALSLAACGNAESGGDSGTAPGTEHGESTKADTADVLTADNWEQIIKEAYGLTFDVPEGWVFKAGEKQNINPLYDLRFEPIAGEFGDEDYAAFCQNIFDQTAQTMEGNFNMEASPPYQKLENYDEMPMIFGIPFGLWYVRTDKGYTQVSITDLPSLNEINIDLIYMTAQLAE